MFELIGMSIVVLLLVYFTNIRPFNNYTPPKGYRIDYNLMELDRIKNELNQGQLMRNVVAGKYNVKDFDFVIDKKDNGEI